MPALSRTSRRLARLGPALVIVLALGGVAGPAAGHVGGTPSDATAGASTVLTLTVGHGCDGSPTTRLEVQVPESVLSVTPTRHPLWDVQVTEVDLEEPATDAHGNEVTRRTDRVTWTARTPLPDGVRDTVELAFQVPDAAGDVLAFPTVQECAEGETAWVEVPAEGQDPHELEQPAPMFEVLPADGDGDGGANAAPDAAAAEESDGSAGLLGWLGLGAGLLGLAAGLLALARTRRTA